MRVVASIEARMGSTRFPGKMMADIHGKPTLQRVIERLRQAKSLDGIILATSDLDADNVLAELASEQGIAVFRGSEDDVLGRVAESHVQMDSDIVVEICGDCPLIDPDILDQAVETFKVNECDILATGVQESFPKGTEIQVFSRAALIEAAAAADESDHREHVTLYFHSNPDKFRVMHLVAPTSLVAPDIRLLLDYEQDLESIRKIYQLLDADNFSSFRLIDIISLLREHPELQNTTADYGAL